MRPQSPSIGQPELVFFVDENLGHQFTSALRVGGLKVKAASVLCPGAKDIEWIPEIARNGWIAITQDKLKENLEEQVAIAMCGAKVFVLIGDASHRDLAALFLRKIKWVRKQVVSHEEAFIGKIYVDGGSTKIITMADLCSRSKSRWGR